jgi:hypothetical protein
MKFIAKILCINVNFATVNLSKHRLKNIVDIAKKIFQNKEKLKQIKK